jgi:hypothetical protein
LVNIGSGKNTIIGIRPLRKAPETAVGLDYKAGRKEEWEKGDLGKVEMPKNETLK